MFVQFVFVLRSSENANPGFQTTFVRVYSNPSIGRMEEDFGGNAFQEFGFRLGGVGFGWWGRTSAVCCICRGNLIGVFRGGIDEGALHFACNWGLSRTTPISVLSLAERGSRLNEPMKTRFRPR